MKCASVKCQNYLTKPQEKNGQQYCCRSCSNSGVIRLKSFESKAKVSTKLKGTLRAKNLNASVSKICPTCNSVFEISFGKRNQKTCSMRCGKFLGAKMSAIVKTAKGTHSGWHNRRGEPSYPEKYFISVFENENISGWIREKKVNKWFIDFAFEDKMLAIEIDGRQHQDEERKKSDELKDKFLSSLGWTVLRINWFNPNTENGKSRLYPQIKEMLGVINAF